MTRGLAVATFALGLAFADGPASAETRKVVAGEQFARGGAWRFFFGSGYRKAWSTPVELPVLDLETEAGGLRPLKQVGGLQSVGLAMAGANGRGYTFRKLEKQPERVLPPAWRESGAADVVRDQTAAAHPAATVIVGALARSVGIPFYQSRLMVMPDDPALGKFRETFAGSVGTFDEYITPGYEGITEIVSTTDLWKRWLEGGPGNRVDSRAFLKARLFDVVTGNWDRHQGQWRWARMPGRAEWEPLPEDADQAFTRYGGFVVGMGRGFMPRFMEYSGEYPGKVEGFTSNSADVTRWIPTDLDWPAFEEVARELTGDMTDQKIDDAMRRMPPEWYALDGARLTKEVEQRRDGLLSFARKVYLTLADRVDVRGSDRDETATVRREGDGSLDVILALRGPDGQPGEMTYHRRFLPAETKEVRVYLFGGNDALVTEGPRSGAIELRVLGGAGDDRLDDSRVGGADLRDSEGRNEILRGPGTRVDTKPWTNPAPNPDTPWLEPRNYGHWTMPSIQAWWEPDEKIMVGGGFTRTSWGFRDYPWATLQNVTLMYSTGYNKVRATYTGDFRLKESAWVARLDLRASGIETLNYYGLGNGTPELPEAEAQTQDYMLWAFPSVVFRPNRFFEAHAGIEVKYLAPVGGGGTFLEEEQPYGYGHFGEVGTRAGFEIDTRGRILGAGPQALVDAGGGAGPRISGVRVLGEGFFVPKAWNATSAFGGVQGSVSGYLGSSKASLAVRAGGRKVWGPYPWFESATIGGSDNVRGYDSRRFRGDSSLFGDAEVRYWLGARQRPLLPLRWGLIGFVDSGRVWLAGETSHKWHTGYGIGLMTQVIGVPLSAGGSIANGDEGVRLYFRFGYSF